MGRSQDLSLKDGDGDGGVVVHIRGIVSLLEDFSGEAEEDRGGILL